MRPISDPLGPRAWCVGGLLALTLGTRPATAFERDRSPLGQTRVWRVAPPLPLVSGDLGWITNQEIAAAAASASAVWASVDETGLRFGPPSAAGRIVVVRTGWAHGEDELAYTSVVDDGHGGIASYRIEIDARRGPFCVRCRERGVVPLERVLLHELGHALGLAHSTSRRAVMAAAFRPEAGESQGLSEDDRNGILALYPLGPGGATLPPAGVVEASATLPAPERGVVWAMLGGLFGAGAYRTWRSKKESAASLDT